MKKTEYRVVLVTCANPAEARKIARAVVERRLAACVNITTAPVESIFCWKEKVETAREHVLMIKTVAKRLPELQHAVKRLHSYDVPEFIVLPIVSGSKEYLDWVRDNVGPDRRSKK